MEAQAAYDDLLDSQASTNLVQSVSSSNFRYCGVILPFSSGSGKVANFALALL